MNNHLKANTCKPPLSQAVKWIYFADFLIFCMKNSSMLYINIYKLTFYRLKLFL